MKFFYKKIYTFFIVVVIIFDLLNINHVFAENCPSCTSASYSAVTRGACTNFPSYSTKTGNQTVTRCDSGCNPPSSYWGCTPALGSICDNGGLGFRTYSGTDTVTPSPKKYYCPGTSCSVACTPNSVAGCNTSCFQDIGLRIFDGTSIVKIAIEPGVATSKLRIAKGGTIYGIVLVNTTDPMASKMRVNTSAGIKALRKLP